MASRHDSYVFLRLLLLLLRLLHTRFLLRYLWWPAWLRNSFLAVVVVVAVPEWAGIVSNTSFQAIF